MSKRTLVIKTHIKSKKSHKTVKRLAAKKLMLETKPKSSRRADSTKPKGRTA